MRMSFSKVKLERANFSFGVKNDETEDVDWFETEEERDQKLEELEKEEAEAKENDESE